jgi:ATP-binding cassette, subfamily B (MDR/TAP), member 1
MFVCTYIYMNVWIYTSEATAKRIRERYLRAILRQDIAFFEKVGAGEVATRIQTDTRTWFCRFLSHIELPTAYITDLVQQGLSEKVPLVVGFFSAFVTGFVLALIRNWRLALAMSTIIPCIGISGGLMNKFLIIYMQCVCSRTF